MPALDQAITPLRSLTAEVLSQAEAQSAREADGVGLVKAGGYLARGKIAETIRECYAVLNRQPDDALARLYLGIAAFKRGDLEVADRLFEGYLASQSGSPPLEVQVREVVDPLRAHRAGQQHSTTNEGRAGGKQDEAVATSRRVLRVGHLHRSPGEVLNINWLITKRCNFTCSYCTVYDNTADYPKLEQLKAAVDKIARLERPEIKVALSGGEPTIHPGYIPFIRHMAERLPNLTTLRTETNLSRTPRFYRELVEAMRDHLSLLAFHAPYHFEFTDVDLLLANARFLAEQGIDVQIRLLAHPEQMPVIKRLTGELGAQRSENLTLILKTIRKNFGSQADDRYTAEDLAWLAEAHDEQELERPISVDFEKTADGRPGRERQQFSPNELIARGLNRFKHMGCYAGSEMLSIGPDGTLDRAVCFRGKPGRRPNIYRDAEIPESFLRPVICPFDACGCPEDIAITKVANAPARSVERATAADRARAASGGLPDPDLTVEYKATKRSRKSSPRIKSSPPIDMQAPFEAAVVITTTLRPELLRAVRSVYEQDLEGRIQILIGIDKPLGDRAVLDAIERERPQNCALSLLDLGYSTAERNGGLYSAGDGGSLRTILSFAANSRHVVYLDDDNWWAKDHLSSLKQAIEGKGWAFSLRWLVDEVTMEPIVVDKWHSVGLGAGAFKDEVGGFADPSTLMVDKLRCAAGLHLWCFAQVNYKEADRRFFRYLARKLPGAGSGRATAYYVIRRKNRLWRDLRAHGIEPKTVADTATSSAAAEDERPALNES